MSFTYGHESVWLVGWIQITKVREVKEQLRRDGRVTLQMPCGTGTTDCIQDLYNYFLGLYFVQGYPFLSIASCLNACMRP